MVITRCGTGCRQHIGHQLGADGHTRCHFFILAGIAVVGHHGGDPTGRGPFEGIDHQKQFNQVVIDRVAGGLDDENIFAPDIFIDFDLDFTIAESLDLGTAQRQVQVFTNLLRPDPDWNFLKKWFRSFGFIVTFVRYSSSMNWLGREDSNLRMQEPKSCVLPLDDAPAENRYPYEPRRPRHQPDLNQKTRDIKYPVLLCG
jgi:hypothetical protein